MDSSPWKITISAWPTTCRSCSAGAASCSSSAWPARWCSSAAAATTMPARRRRLAARRPARARRPRELVDRDDSRRPPRPRPATSASCARDPRGDRRSVPRRRVERAQRCSPRAASCAATSGPASARRPTVAEGVPVTINLTLLDTDRRAARRSPARPCTCGTATARAATRCTPQGVEDENYLRGVQESDADGVVTFQTIFPPPTRAAGRTSTSRCTRASTRPPAAATLNATSQVALPEDACAAVYATEGYEQSVAEPRPDVAGDRQRVQRRRRGLPAGDRHRRRRQRLRDRPERVRRPDRRVDAVVAAAAWRRWTSAGPVTSTPALRRGPRPGCSSASCRSPR